MLSGGDYTDPVSGLTAKNGGALTAQWILDQLAKGQDVELNVRWTGGGGRPINVEYVSANPTGPMHIGHARGAVVGDVLASLLADLVWFELGRRRGYGVLRVLCRISLEPDTCVKRTTNAFRRHGSGTLVAAARWKIDRIP